MPSPTATEYSLLKSEKSVGSHSQQTWPACSQDVGFTSLNTRDIRLVVREVGDRMLTAEGVPAADVLQTFRPTVLGGLMPEQQFLQQPCLDCRTVRRIREQLLLLQQPTASQRCEKHLVILTGWLGPVVLGYMAQLSSSNKTFAIAICIQQSNVLLHRC